MKLAKWVVFCLLAAFCGWGAAWAAPSDGLLTGAELEFDQVYDQLAQLTPEQLLADLERAYLLLDQSPMEGRENALVPWSAAMMDRIDEFDPGQLEEIILDRQRDLYFRGALIQLRELRQDAGQADPRLYQLLTDETEPEYLRTTLLLHLDFDTPQRLALLEQLAAGQGELGDYARKKLSWASRETGYQGRTWQQTPLAQPEDRQRAPLWGLLAGGAGMLAAAWVYRRFGGRLFRQLDLPKEEENQAP